jgi:hypothetical protein
MDFIDVFMSAERIKASNFVDPTASIVKSALSLAAAIVQQLAVGNDVIVDLAGLKGLSSSYFNPILQIVKQEFGIEAFGTRVRFSFDSSAQRLVFNRSFEAVRGLPPSSAVG